MNRKLYVVAGIIFFMLNVASAVRAQTTEFTYQGRLQDSNLPATANYDFAFSLWDSVANGTQLPPTQFLNGVAVTNGMFTVRLNFGLGNQFNGSERFLQVLVRPAGGGEYTTLSPRQAITSGPYAIRSLNSTTADTATNSLQLGGVAANQFIVNTTMPQLGVSFNVEGTGTASILNAGIQFNLNNQRILGIGAPGFNNLFVGQSAGGSMTTGSNDSFFGYLAGAFNTTGLRNFFLVRKPGRSISQEILIRSSENGPDRITQRAARIRFLARGPGLVPRPRPATLFLDVIPALSTPEPTTPCSAIGRVSQTPEEISIHSTENRQA
ncbi:MAG: hypothetical protein ACKVRN_14920 [Pyrinomonadaceae bacterium]